MRRAHTQRGASLIIVLALVLFLGALVPAVLGLVLTGSKVTVPVIENRREVYAASSALDAAIQLGRHDADIGVPGGKCPEQDLVVDGYSVKVTAECIALSAEAEWCFLDRFVSYTAVVSDPANDEVVTATAEVAYRFDPQEPWRTEVFRWSPQAGGPATTTTLPPCADGGPPPESTTTTTTPAAIVGSYATWEPPNLISSARNQGKWRAEGTLKVFDDTGSVLDGAAVTVTYEVQAANDTWSTPQELPAGTTNEAGNVTFHSPDIGSSYKAARFTVVNLETPGLDWVADAHPVTATT
jgi:hypothetical protein